MKGKFIKFAGLIAAIIIALSLFACETVYDPSKDESVVNLINTAYFSKADFDRSRLTTVDVKSGESSYKYLISITSSCAVSLYEYTADVELLSVGGNVIGNETVSETAEIEAGEKFEFCFYVAESVYTDTRGVRVVFNGKSHENTKGKDGDRAHTVIFVYNNGQLDSESVAEGTPVFKPSDPVKKNYIFDGWYDSSFGGSEYDFSKPITKDLTLYARYKIDEASLVSKISTDAIKGVVKVYNRRYNQSSSAAYPSYSEGLGFCFHVSNNNYYILTNCHVAYKGSAFNNQSFTIEDYQGRTYEGYLYKNPKKSDKAISADYDLACLYFRASSANVKALPFEKVKPKTGEDVVSLSAPRAESNNITYGSVGGYEKVALNDTQNASINVRFDAISHTAFKKQGSSGAPLLNLDLKVIGVNYAASDDGKTGYAIPAEKMYEFLVKYVYN